VIRAIATGILRQILLVIVGGEAFSCTEITELCSRGQSTGRISVDVGVDPSVDHDAVTNPQGATILHRRIRFAADEACSPLPHGDLSSKAHKNACMDKAIAGGVMRAGAPQPFSVYNSKHSTPLVASPTSSIIASR
jgi:UrcA family protein